MFSATRTSQRPMIIRGLAARSVHTLPSLPYAYNALEPYISEEIMKLHHQKHHQAYVNGLNAAEAAYAKTDSTRERIGLQAAVKFNGGGHINHSLFWTNLAPATAEGGKVTDGPLKQALEREFGTIDEFKKKFNATAGAVQGSGWGWLGVNPGNKKLELVTTANQDPLLSLVPLIGIDVWEHAFYLQYKNVKPDYLAAIWNVINFKEAERRFLESTQ